MYFNKNSFGSVLFLAVLQTSNVCVVHARPGKNKGAKKTTKATKVRKCMKGLKQKDLELFDKYDALPNTNLVSGGVYSLLDPPIAQRISLERILYDRPCTKTNAFLCLEKCEETPGCTGISAGFDADAVENPLGICRLYNTEFSTEPFGRKAPAQAIELDFAGLGSPKNVQEVTSYILKGTPTPPAFVPTNITTGTPDFFKYILPAAECVGLSGSSIEACNKCAIQTITQSKITGCDGLLEAVCGGTIFGKNGTCSDVCGAEKGCTSSLETFGLAFFGQPYQTNATLGAGLLYGCITGPILEPTSPDGFFPANVCPNK